MKWLGSLRGCKLGRYRCRRAAAAAAAAAAQAPGPGRVTSETLTEQPRPDGGPGAAASAALRPLPLPDQHLPAPNVTEARRSRAAGGRSDLRGWAAPPPNGPLWLRRPEAASRSGREGRGRRCYAPRPAPKARPPRRLALQSQGPLATSFFHSQKKRKGIKKKEGREGKKGGGKISPRTPAVTGTALRGVPLVEIS